MRDQCERAQVPFVKQWGGVRKSKARRHLDGKTSAGIPSRAELPVLDHGRRMAGIAHDGATVPDGCRGARADAVPEQATGGQ